MRVVAASLVTTLALLALFAHAVLADRAIRIRRATPVVAFAPTGVRIEVDVPINAENRAVIVQCDGDDFSRSSGWTVDGLNGRAFYAVEWRELPAGAYDVTAIVRSATAERGRATARLLRTAP